MMALRPEASHLHGLYGLDPLSGGEPIRGVQRSTLGSDCVCCSLGNGPTHAPVLSDNMQRAATSSSRTSKKTFPATRYVKPTRQWAG